MHDRRMLEELFREALMVGEQEEQERSEGIIGDHLQNPIMIRDYATSERGAINRVINSPRR